MPKSNSLAIFTGQPSFFSGPGYPSASPMASSPVMSSPLSVWSRCARAWYPPSTGSLSCTGKRTKDTRSFSTMSALLVTTRTTIAGSLVSLIYALSCSTFWSCRLLALRRMRVDTVGTKHWLHMRLFSCLLILRSMFISSITTSTVANGDS